ncbi:LamG-like jellyroll fold domain-containing protein [Streptomyces sp. NPDC050988]|uniref:LamG domain-containing protein n=1 Tax=Streptomyces sp. NPDC050988 TaxID=3365637 RepID=UPI0037AC17EF
MAALESDDPGSVGAYQLISRLGAGEMGRVYLGRSPGGRLVAVKVVHSELLRRPEQPDRHHRAGGRHEQGRGFTVSACVRLSVTPGSFATAVSQDGEDHSCFYLQHSTDERQWFFAGATQRPVARTAPVAGVWTHLVGVCDGPGRRLRVYVDGVQEGTVADTIEAGGSLVIARAKYNGGPADFLPGAVKNVRIYDRALTSAQIETLKLAS